MKNIAIIFLSFCCLSAFAQANYTDQLSKAEKFYAEKDFESALNIYSEIENSGNFSFELYYNMGNCHFKLDDIASSILYYERAKKLNPTNEDLLFNLEYAQSKTADKVEALPKSRAANLYDSVLNLFSVDGWATVSVVLFITGLIALFLFFYLSQISIKKLSLISSIIVLVLSGSSYLLASSKLAKENIREGIVFSSTVNVTSSPNNSGTELFVIHEGLKVEILETSGDYVKIKLADGNVGWIETSNIQVI